MADLAASEAAPSVTRVSDAPETQFSFATRKAGSAVDKAKSAALKAFLRRRKGWDLEQMCLSFIGYEGTPAHVKDADPPYIRAFLLDRGALADVSETAAPWSALEPLHRGVVAAAGAAFDEIGVRGWVMWRLSH